MKLLCLILFCSLSLEAQVSASISGAVSDPSGAVVPAAKVTITNSATGAVRETSTDAAGRYVAPALAAGEYEIRAAKAGFTDELRTGVHLAVGQIASIDFSLRLGQSSQAVTVDADAPIVSSASPICRAWYPSH